MWHARSWVVLLSAVGLIVGAAPALADKDRNSSGPESKQEREYRSEREERKQVKEERKRAKKEKRQKERGSRFYRADRVTVRDFYSHNPSALPPGLAKRDGRLPPGLAKRGGNLPPGLARGQVITPDIEVHLLPLPRELEIKLPPPPHEVIRRIIGRDIVLIHERNRKVLDVMRDALP